MIYTTKKIAFLLLHLALLSLFTACGHTLTEQNTIPAGSESTNASIQSGSTPKITLKAMHWEDSAIFIKLNEEFQKKYPDIKVEMDMLPAKDYPGILGLRLGSGEVDLAGVDPFGQLINKAPGILKSDSLYDLTGQEFLKNYNPSTFTNGVKYNGKVLAVPTALNTIVVYYNKNLFKEMNLEIPKTYSAFIEVCKKIKSAGTTPIAFGGQDGWPINVDMIAIESAIVRSKNPDFYKKLTTGETRFTDPQFVEVLNKTKEISNFFEDKSLGVAYADAVKLFAEQKTAMLIDGSWSLGEVRKEAPKFDVGIFIFPGSDNVDPNKFVPVKYGLCWAVSNRSENNEAALKYLAWFSQKDIYKQFILGVKQLPTQDGITFEDPLLTEIAGLLGNTVEFCDQLYPPGSCIDPWQSLQKMMVGSMTPQEVAEYMQKSVDNLKR